MGFEIFFLLLKLLLNFIFNFYNVFLFIYLLYTYWKLLTKGFSMLHSDFLELNKHLAYLMTLAKTMCCDND